jgi:hypothetical protein
MCGAACANAKLRAVINPYGAWAHLANQQLNQLHGYTL